MVVESQPGYRDPARACHAMLLRLAGRVPDGLLAEARHWLVAGELRTLAHAVASAAVTADVPLAETDARLLASLLARYGTDATPLAALAARGEEPAPAYRFAPASPVVLREAGATLPQRLDLTAGPDRHRHPGLIDDFDRAAIASASAAADASAGVADPDAHSGAVAGAVAGGRARSGAGAAALWRGYRFPRERGVPVRRVYLAQAAPGGDAGLLALELQLALARCGEPDPQVEVFEADQPLPRYHQSVLAHAALLWSATPAVAVQVVAGYDSVDPMLGERFKPDHPRLPEPAERERLAAHLEAGTLLLAAGVRGEDVLDPGRPAVVPLELRTDGRFVWAASIAYYLTRYHLAPAATLLDHLRAHPDPGPPPGHLELFRAMVAVQAAAGGEPVWSSGTRRSSVAVPGR